MSKLTPLLALRRTRNARELGVRRTARAAFAGLTVAACSGSSALRATDGRAASTPKKSTVGAQRPPTLGARRPPTPVSSEPFRHPGVLVNAAAAGAPAGSQVADGGALRTEALNNAEDATRLRLCEYAVGVSHLRRESARLDLLRVPI